MMRQDESPVPRKRLQSHVEELRGIHNSLQYICSLQLGGSRSSRTIGCNEFRQETEKLTMDLYALLKRMEAN